MSRALANDRDDWPEQAGAGDSNPITPSLAPPRGAPHAKLLTAMDIIVNEELLAYIDPLTPDEHAALERSILAEGCRVSEASAQLLAGLRAVSAHVAES